MAIQKSGIRDKSEKFSSMLIRLCGFTDFISFKINLLDWLDVSYSIYM